MTPEDDPDLSELRDAWDRATPRPEPALRAAHLRLAQDNFQRLHAGSGPAGAGAAPPRAAWGGLRELFGFLAHPGAGAGAAAVAGLALLLVTPPGQEVLRERLSQGETDAKVAPEAAGEAATGMEAAATEEEEAGAPAADGFVGAQSVAPEPGERESVAEGATAEVASRTGEAEPAGDGAEPAPAAASVAAAPERAAPAPAATAQAEAGPRAGSGGAAARVAEVAPREDSDGAADTAAPAMTALAPAREDAGGGSPLGDMVALAPAAEVAADLALGPGAGSLAAVREALRAGVLPTPGAVAVQELVSGLVPAGPVEGPDASAVASAVASGLPAPWDPSVRLVVVRVRAGAALEEAELELDGAAALGGPEGAVQLGALGPGDTALRVLALEGREAPGPVRLRWTDAATGQRREAKAGLEPGPASPEVRLAAAVAGWALLLRGQGLGGWGFGEAAALAAASLDEVPGGAEAVELMRRSEEAAR